jgi:hypothetical protein
MVVETSPTGSFKKTSGLELLEAGSTSLPVHKVLPPLWCKAISFIGVSQATRTNVHWQTFYPLRSKRRLVL